MFKKLIVSKRNYFSCLLMTSFLCLLSNPIPASNEQKFFNLLDNSHFRNKKICKKISKLFESNLIDVNQLNKKGIAALHYAAHYGYEDLVRMLLLKDADVNIATQDEHGY